MTAPIQVVRGLNDDGSITVVIGGGGGGGTSSPFGSPFPADGTAVGFKDSTGATMAPGNLDVAGNLKVSVASGGSVPSVSDYHKVSAASNNAAVIKNSPGIVYAVKAFNNAGYPVFVKLYDKATAPDPTSDTVIRTIGVQAGLPRDDVLGGALAFAAGIGIAIVKGISDTDNTAVAASDVVVDISYA